MSKIECEYCGDTGIIEGDSDHPEENCRCIGVKRMKLKIKIPEMCIYCQFNKYNIDLSYHECMLFEKKLGDLGDYIPVKCPQCLSKPEIKIEFEE